jgi:hypothetical protein
MNTSAAGPSSIRIVPCTGKPRPQVAGHVASCRHRKHSRHQLSFARCPSRRAWDKIIPSSFLHPFLYPTEQARGERSCDQVMQRKLSNSPGFILWNQRANSFRVALPNAIYSQHSQQESTHGNPSPFGIWFRMYTSMPMTFQSHPWHCAPNRLTGQCAAI